jgi:Fe-S-cluster containining protein
LHGKFTYGIQEKWLVKQIGDKPLNSLLCPMTDKRLVNWEKKSKERQKLYKGFLQKAPKNQVYGKLTELHDEAFSKINCLECASCCKSYSPRFKTPDIKRISRALQLKESVFIEKYLKVDEDGDYVLQQLPCPFLGADNYCSIYDDRPSDCHRFPYTDEDVILKRPVLTLKNSSFCPATYYVLERLMEEVEKR